MQTRKETAHNILTILEIWCEDNNWKLVSSISEKTKVVYDKNLSKPVSVVSHIKYKLFGLPNRKINIYLNSEDIVVKEYNGTCFTQQVKISLTSNYIEGLINALGAKV